MRKGVDVRRVTPKSLIGKQSSIVLALLVESYAPRKSVAASYRGRTARKSTR